MVLSDESIGSRCSPFFNFYNAEKFYFRVFTGSGNDCSSFSDDLQ